MSARDAIAEHLVTHPGETSAAVARATGLDPATVRQTARRMVAAGDLVKVGHAYAVTPDVDGAERDTSVSRPSVTVAVTAGTVTPAAVVTWAGECHHPHNRRTGGETASTPIGCANCGREFRRGAWVPR